MTEEEVNKILAILKSIWPNHPVLEETATAWHMAFEDVPYPLAMDAVKRWIKGGSQWFPTPSQLLKTISVRTVAPNLIPESAWIEVLEQARKVGYGRRTVFHNGESVLLPGPVFSHPLIEKAVESVGWKNICHSDEPTIVRAQFLKTLNNFIDAEVERAQIGELPDVIGINGSLAVSPAVIALNGGGR